MNRKIKTALISVSDKKKIKTALISVSDKNKLKPLLNILKKNKIKIISSGGTYEEIKRLKFKCLEVSKFTSSPEILEGRVKTLHPKIHAGILHDRKNKAHKSEMSKQKFPSIDLIVVNFYPFQKVVTETKNPKKVIENIDIGGPTMVRAAFSQILGDASAKGNEFSLSRKYAAQVHRDSGNGMPPSESD